MTIDPHDIELNADQKQQLAWLAERNGTSWQEVLSRALRLLQPQPSKRLPTESLHDALQRRGLLGCIEIEPADLSTNPQYMQGLGTTERGAGAH